MLTLPREAASVPLARHTMTAALKSAGVAGDCLDEVRLALSEACTNVYHHADAGDCYEVMINISDEQLTMDVVDAGSIFGQHPGHTAMPGVEAENGRGIALMAAFSDLAVFDAVAGDGGSVHLTKRLYWAEGAMIPAQRQDGHPDLDRPRSSA
jgi:serine/threonine-protein kinase RsbW